MCANYEFGRSYEIIFIDPRQESRNDKQNEG